MSARDVTEEQGTRAVEVANLLVEAGIGVFRAAYAANRLASELRDEGNEAATFKALAKLCQEIGDIGMDLSEVSKEYSGRIRESLDLHPRGVAAILKGENDDVR